MLDFPPPREEDRGRGMRRPRPGQLPTGNDSAVSCAEGSSKAQLELASDRCWGGLAWRFQDHRAEHEYQGFRERFFEPIHRGLLWLSLAVLVPVQARQLLWALSRPTEALLRFQPGTLVPILCLIAVNLSW